MNSVAVLSCFVVLCCSGSGKAFPLYSDSPLTTQEDLLEKLVEEVEESENRDAAGEPRGARNIYPLFLDQNRDIVGRGNKQTIDQEKITNMVDGLKEVVFKLAAADKLRSHGFTRADPGLPKNNKRACFWKYCVTN
ncbi:urotensin-related peptide 1 [Engraulis encrasicolus]|uniref:urotensin-related peptide 1 n=1 Tax=Engraulis encrasicolus TaxID=184585 RepID=UPI002FCECDC2